jgi:hypothetical protein
MPLPWLASLLISLALNIVAYLIMPRAPTQKPAATKDMEAPTADAGRPIPKVFGTVTVKGLNVLAFTDLRKVDDDIKP